MENTPIIKFDRVTREYGDARKVLALANVSFEISRGETVAIMGPSGSGKSTVLNLICGLDSPTNGDVYLDGKNLSTLNDDDRTRLRRTRVGMVFQTFNLLPTLTALENVSLTLRLQGIGRKESELRAEEMLDHVDLSERSGHVPDELSGGERQRVAIARALIFNPPLLLADEPTGNLDSKAGERVLKYLADLHKQFDTTIVLVTHDKHAASYCRRKIVMHDGAIVEDNG